MRATCLSAELAMTRSHPWSDVCASVDEIYARYADSICTLARSFSRSEADAEDLVQTVWLRLAQHVAKGQPIHRTTEAAWLRAILKNCYLEHVRRESGACRVLTDPTVEFHADSKCTRPFALNDMEPIDLVTHDQLEAATRSLSPRLREAYQLLSSGKSYKEIAATLGIRETTVAKRIFDARRKLRRELPRLVDENVSRSVAGGWVTEPSSR